MKIKQLILGISLAAAIAPQAIAQNLPLKDPPNPYHDREIAKKLWGIYLANDGDLIALSWMGDVVVGQYANGIKKFPVLVVEGQAKDGVPVIIRVFDAHGGAELFALAGFNANGNLVLANPREGFRKEYQRVAPYQSLQGYFWAQEEAQKSPEERARQAKEIEEAREREEQWLRKQRAEAPIQDQAAFDRGQQTVQNIIARQQEAKSDVQPRKVVPQPPTPVETATPSPKPVETVPVLPTIGATPFLAPSRSLMSFDGPYFSVQYPANWHAPGNWQAEPQAISPPNGVISGGIVNRVILGVAIGAYRPPWGTDGRLPDFPTATNQLIAAFENGNKFDVRRTPPKQVPALLQANQFCEQSLVPCGMKAVTKIADVTVDQRTGKSVEFINQGTSAEPGRYWLVTIPRNDGSLSYLMFVAPEKVFDILRPTYEQMLRTFQLKTPITAP